MPAAWYLACAMRTVAGATAPHTPRSATLKQVNPHTHRRLPIIRRICFERHSMLANTYNGMCQTYCGLGLAPIMPKSFASL